MQRQNAGANGGSGLPHPKILAGRRNRWRPRVAAAEGAPESPEPKITVGRVAESAQSPSAEQGRWSRRSGRAVQVDGVAWPSSRCGQCSRADIREPMRRTGVDVAVGRRWRQQFAATEDRRSSSEPREDCSRSSEPRVVAGCRSRYP